MRAETRSSSFTDTNAGKSHNRIANLSVGTHRAPRELVRFLSNLDANDLASLQNGGAEHLAGPRRYRHYRSDSTLHCGISTRNLRLLRLLTYIIYYGSTLVSHCSPQWYSTCIVPVLRRQKHDTVCEGVGQRYFTNTVRSNRQIQRLDATLFQGTETRSNLLHQILILRFFRSYDRSNRPEQVYMLAQRSLYNQRTVDVTRLESFAIGIRFGCQFET